VRGASWQWDAEVQFLASRGYAVLQPEYRGSTGFGDRHFRAGFKQWGLAMQDDLADCAKWAVDKGVADAKRIAIAGASYGGYATVMGLVRHPEIFRCGVSWVGVTDPMLLHSSTWTDITRDASRHQLSVVLGDPAADAELLKQASAMTHASRIRSPLMLAYGRLDRRVDLVHGERLRDALRPHNRDLEWVVYDDEGHGWWRTRTRLDFWGRVEKFLARHLAAG
jgi:dipeptidyl aminopeptidase/acylaminoacyl peptidase